jgi:hypothetical protein
MPSSRLHLIPGPSGWVQARFFDKKSAYRRLFVRFEPDAGGRWAAAEWRIPGYPDDVLRQVPYNRIRKAVDADERIRDELARRISELPEPGFDGAFGEPERSKPIRLVRPKGRRLDDSFYQQVAVTYRQAIGRGLNPRQAIAEAATVSPDVAGRWIYEARKRDLIPKTTPGKVTA